MTEVANRVRRLVADHLDRDSVPNDSDSFIDDLGADSLDYVELLMAAEDEFDIEISDDVAAEIKTVGQAIDLIEKKLGVAA